MQSLFNMTPPQSVGVLRFPEWNYVRDGMRRNVATVLEFYRKNPMAVQSSHLLVRLLHSITIPQSQPIERYYDNVDSLALNLSMALNLTSSIFKGKVWDGVFYGEGSKEILIAHNDWFDPVTAHKNWKGLQPIRILRSPHTDLGYNIPNGKRAGSETGLSVISINIPLLAIQYRAFRQEEQRIAEYTGNDSQRSIYQFVHMYPLVNAVMSQTDTIVFNRAHRVLTGAPMGESLRKHSFYLTDYSLKLTSVHMKIIDSIEKHGKDMNTTLQSVPLPMRDNLGDWCQLPDMAPTRQVVWALIVARLPVLSFLFESARGGPTARNQQEVSKVLRTIKSMRADSLLRSNLSGSVLEEVQAEVDSLI